MTELREALEEAWDDDLEEAVAEVVPDSGEAEAAETDGEGATEETEGEPTTEGEKHEKIDGESEAPTVQDDGGNSPEAKGEKEPAAEESAEAPATKPPSSWTPKAREGWGKIPAEAQAQINKRESEINNVLQQSAGSRRAVDSLNNVLAPHKQALIAEGIQDPFQAIGELLNTRAALTRGTPAEKATNMANLIKQFGVDINMLDDALVGTAPQNPPANAQMEAMLTERMAPMNQFLQQQQEQQQQQQYQQQQDANTSVEAFQQNAEFMQDVRNDMADMMDMAAARGQQMTLQQAYDKACAINPEISAIMAERATKQQLMGGQAAVRKKQLAASSITGRQSGTGGGGGGMSMRDTISAAFDEQE